MFSGWSRRRILAVVGVGLVALAAIGIGLRLSLAVDVAEVPFSDLLRAVDQGVVAEVVVNGDTLDVKLTDGKTMRTVHEVQLPCELGLMIE